MEEKPSTENKDKKIETPYWQKQMEKQKGSRSLMIVSVILLSIMLIASVLVVSYFNRIGFERDVKINLDDIYFNIKPTGTQLNKVTVDVYVSGSGGTPNKQKEAYLEIYAEKSGLMQGTKNITQMQIFSGDVTKMFTAALLLGKSDSYTIKVRLFENGKLTDTWTKELYVV